MTGPLMVHPSAVLGDFSPGFEPTPGGLSPDTMAVIYQLVAELVIGLAAFAVSAAVWLWLESWKRRRAEAAPVGGGDA